MKYDLSCTYLPITITFLSLLIISPLLCFLVLKKLHNKVAAHANSEKNNGEDDLGEDTDSASLGDEG